jgi:hypothetical protein
MPVRARHGARPHRLPVRIRDFHSREQGPTPCGAAGGEPSCRCADCRNAHRVAMSNYRQFGQYEALRHCAVEESGCPQRPHKPKIAGSNPARATDRDHSCVAQAGSSARPLTGRLQVRGLPQEPWRLSTIWPVRHPVKVEGAGSSPVDVASHARVAQWRERHPDAMEAAGSCPAAGTTLLW